MAQLSKPFAFLHRRGGFRGGPGPRFAILAYLRGEATFLPAGEINPVTRAITRIWIQRLDKPNRVPYYDISASNLQAQLAGYLDTQGFIGLEFSVRAHGYGPSKQFGLTVAPIGHATNRSHSGFPTPGKSPEFT